MLEGTVNEVAAVRLQCASVLGFISAGESCPGLLDAVSHTLQFPH